MLERWPGKKRARMSVERKSERLRFIQAKEYLPYAAQLKHVFLTGDLKKPQPHPFIHEPRLEFVLCFYESHDDGLPHWHADITEYELVLEGHIGYFELATGQHHWLGPGDFVTVPMGVCVQRKVREHCRTLAVKVPSDASKVHCQDCGRECPYRLVPQRRS